MNRSSVRFAARSTLAGLFAASVSASCLIGCSVAPPAPDVTSGRFTGPRIELDPYQEFHSVTLHAPQPGWTIRLDRVDDRFGYKQVYVSIRRPHPMAPVAPLDQPQRVLTSVLAQSPVEVFARELGYDAPLDAEDAYTLAIPRADAR